MFDKSVLRDCIWVRWLVLFFSIQDRSIDSTHRLTPEEVLSGSTKACGLLDDLDGLVRLGKAWWVASLVALVLVVARFAVKNES